MVRISIVVAVLGGVSVACGGGTQQGDDTAGVDAPRQCGSNDHCTGLDGGSDPGSGSGSGSDLGSGMAAALATCVSETNHDRSLNGKSALTESSALEAYAATGAEYDYSHTPHSHFQSTSGGGIAFAENECPVQGNWSLDQGGGDLVQTVKNCVAAFYAEGPGSDYSTHGHYINMMGDYGSLGCGIYIGSDGDSLTIVQDYGD